MAAAHARARAIARHASRGSACQTLHGYFHSYSFLNLLKILTLAQPIRTAAPQGDTAPQGDAPIAACENFATVHRPGQLADVAVVSSPRSGSTWLMEMIATQTGMKYINEPDHKALLERHHALRIAPRWLWLSLTRREKQDLAHYLLDDRRSGLFGPVNPLEGIHSWRTNRRALKLIRMTALVEWLDALGFETVYLLRHPIPQAQSCMHRRHRILLDDFLADPRFLQYLNTDIISLCSPRLL